MNESGITQRLLDFCKILLQRYRGGLGHSMVLTGTVFSGLCGSATADTAATTRILAPSMLKEGYPREFTAGLGAATGVLGAVIPPSALMIVYAATVGTSVGAMFMGGVGPGLLISAFLMITVAIIARKRGYPKSDIPFSWIKLLFGLKDASLALVMPVLIIVGIRGGIFTPTEGGAVAVAYSLFIGLCVFRTLTWKRIFDTAVTSGIMAATIMLIVSASAPFGWIITIGRLPAIVAEQMLALTTNPILVLLMINLILLVVGMFLEGAAVILLLAPILAPIAVAVGIDPLHFAVVMVVNISIGLITPPAGINLFVAAPIAGAEVGSVFRSVMPFLAAQLLVLAIISFYPPIITWLPNTFR